MSQTIQEEKVRNVVLVHGGFVDGSGWEGVYKSLTEKGYNVTVVQNPTISLADDVAVTKGAIDAQDGPVILVGHSYGGCLEDEAELVSADHRRSHDRSGTPAIHVEASWFQGG